MHFPVNWKKALKVFHVACVVLWCVLCGDHAECVVGGCAQIVTCFDVFVGCWW